MRSFAKLRPRQVEVQRRLPKSKALFVSALLFLISCATQQVKFDEASSGRWKARALVKDTEKNKSHVVFAEIVAQRPQNLRMDVTTSLGIHLARLTMNENTLSYLLPREKKYFSGAAGPKVLKPILKIQLDPRLVMSLLFDVPPQEGTWNCERDAKERLKSCVSEESGVELTWTEREAARKTVAVKTEAGFVQLQLTGYQPNVEVSEEMFHLKAPPGFKVIRPSTTSSSNTATE